MTENVANNVVQVNSDDTDYYLLEIDDAVIALYNKDEVIKELKQENKQLRKWCEEFNALDVAKENQQLKELLDYCRELLEMDGYENVVEEINNAIGEK